MKILEKIDNSRSYLSETLSFADSSLVDDCIDFIKGRYLTQIVSKNEISDEDLELIRSVAKCQSEIIKSDDFYNLVAQMSLVARERSHGAAPLHVVFVKKAIYDDLFKDVDNAEIKILGTRIKPISRIIDTELSTFGLCKPKFDNITPNMLVILGKLNN